MTTAVSPLLKWQYDQITQALLLLQGHLSDPTCPCRSETESCVRKHLMEVEALARETAPMEEEEWRERLLALAADARTLREVEEARLCGEEAVWPVEPLAWARAWRKELEGRGLGCRVQERAPMGGHFRVRVKVGRLGVDWEGRWVFATGPREYDCLVDTGATYVGLPPGEIEALELSPTGREEAFRTATGPVLRPVYHGLVEVGGEKSVEKVVPTPDPIIGTQALQHLGWVVDPVEHRLVRIRPYLLSPRRAEAIGEEIRGLPLSQVQGKEGPSPDPYGSRCRDPATGQWVPTEACEGPIPEAPVGEGSRLTWAVGPQGLTRYLLHYEVRPLASLIPSHDPFTFEPDPRFPRDLQPRLRGRAVNRLQVEAMARDLDPDLLLQEFHALDRGAPIVTGEGYVLSGNGRVMALQRARRLHPEAWGRYQERLREVAGQFGLSEGALRGVEDPVLVRVLAQEVDLPAFVEEANAPVALSPSAVEQALRDAGRITPEMLMGLEVGEGESLEQALRSPRNRAFVHRFLEALPLTEQARLVDARGELNQDGLRRVVMAVWARAFPGEAGLKLAEVAFEALDPEVRTILSGIGRALGPLAQAVALAREGQRDPGLDIGEDLAGAVAVLVKIKRTPGLDVPTYLAQAQMFGRELTPFQEEVLRDLWERRRSARRVGLLLRNYAHLVLSQPPPQQGTLLDLERPGKEALWATARRKEEAGEDVPGPVAMGQAPLEGIDWCNISPVEQVELWSYRRFREALLTALGQGGRVRVCNISLTDGRYQVSVAPGALVRGVQKALGPWAVDVVLEPEGREAHILVVVPAGGEALRWEPQEVASAPRGERGEQARLLEGVGLPALHRPPQGCCRNGFATQFRAPVCPPEGPCLSPGAIGLEVPRGGRFVRERLENASAFDPRSYRTVVEGEHRVVVGCPRGAWDTALGRCLVGTRAQAILHPREEAPALIAQARERGIPVLEVDAVEMERARDTGREERELLFEDDDTPLALIWEQEPEEDIGKWLRGRIEGRTPEEFIRDAEALWEKAREHLRAGDIRDASEKAWGATVAGATAVMVHHTGRVPRTTGDVRRTVERLADRHKGDYEALESRYRRRMEVLHGACFYYGECGHPKVEEYIGETGDFIALARRLAGLP